MFTLLPDEDLLFLKAIEKHCKLPEGAYATVLNVDHKVTLHEDKMETFFLVRISDAMNLTMTLSTIV